MKKEALITEPAKLGGKILGTGMQRAGEAIVHLVKADSISSETWERQKNLTELIRRFGLIGRYVEDPATDQTPEEWAGQMAETIQKNYPLNDKSVVEVRPLIENNIGAEKEQLPGLKANARLLTKRLSVDHQVAARSNSHPIYISSRGRPQAANAWRNVADDLRGMLYEHKGTDREGITIGITYPDYAETVFEGRAFRADDLRHGGTVVLRHVGLVPADNILLPGDRAESGSPRTIRTGRFDRGEIAPAPNRQLEMSQN